MDAVRGPLPASPAPSRPRPPTAVVVTHARDPPADTSVLRAPRPPVHQQADASAPLRSRAFTVPHRLREIADSVGTGFLYGTLFGGVLAVVDGYRGSPQHQRLRGILHHGKHLIPATAGRIAVVTGLFRLASWGLDAARGHERADLLTVLLAAPLAGAVLRARHGPKAALSAAFTFGSVGAVMVLFNVAQAKVTRHRDAPEDVLEEIAFAEEVDEIDME